MPTPTLLFVHGALVRDGAWWWSPTADLLRERTGVESRAVTLPSCGETDGPGAARGGDLADDAAALRLALDDVAAAGGSAVVVGHSYGGTVLAEAGAHPAVEHLLFVSSYLPDVGSTQGSIMSTEPDPVTIRPDDAGRIVLDGYDVESFGARFLQDADAATQRAAWERTTAQDLRAFGTPTGAAGWSGVDSTAIVCTDDRSTTVGLQRRHAERATRSVELPTGHHPFITRPDLVVEQIAAFLR
ncbi:pimeloyl-ACP methyl ester carboxylesterase [Curtobacterium flaccumfaciens]|uniref:Pimeloyl-ACP methyl ester carboxylesterase n=1 Tax=Curtobacterium flaccumfaciens TaxID=2035 RepID=A0A4R6DL69_9MICO|nr:alpha/beta hydrolase [Curtobacterium flaccumfaciens]TDN45473.1 pimeloyl-ACP methyl ester carboxylesterase [Curtobacterium flaccumfaciens]